MKKKREKTEQCPECEKFFTTTGIENHIVACEKKHEVKDNISPKPAKKLLEEQDLMEDKTKSTSKNPYVPPSPVPQPEPTPPASPPQTFQQTREEDYVDLRQDNKTKREILAQQKLDKQLGAALGDMDPIDRLMKIQQLKVASTIGQDNNQNQNQMLFQMQNQNFQGQLENQRQLAQIQKDTQQQHVDFMKAELDRARKESGGTGELSKFKELAKEMEYSKSGESDIGKLSEMVGSNIKHLPSIIASLKEQGGKEALAKYGIDTKSQPQNPIPASQEGVQEVADSNLLNSAIMPPQPAPKGSAVMPEPIPAAPVANPGPPHLSDADIEAYAKKNYLVEEPNSDYLNQALGLGRFKRTPPKK